MRYIGNTSVLSDLNKSGKQKEVETNIFHHEKYSNISS